MTVLPLMQVSYLLLRTGTDEKDGSIRDARFRRQSYKVSKAKVRLAAFQGNCGDIFSCSCYIILQEQMGVIL
jgi:hypothetical protein